MEEKANKGRNVKEGLCGLGSGRVKHSWVVVFEEVRIEQKGLHQPRPKVMMCTRKSPLKSFLHLILRIRIGFSRGFVSAWVLIPFSCSVLWQSATTDPHVASLQKSNLFVLFACQQIWEKVRKWSNDCPLNKGGGLSPFGDVALPNWKFPAQWSSSVNSPVWQQNKFWKVASTSTYVRVL